jgi:hypothetical protein
MLMRKVITYVNNSDFPVISLAFTASATIFTLALCSFIQILDFIPIHQYPILIFISSLAVFSIELFLPAMLKKYDSAYKVFFVGLVAAIVLNVFCYHPFFSDLIYKTNGYLFADFIFVVSISLVTFLKKTLSVITYHTGSYLKNHRFDSDIYNAKSAGFIFAAVYMLLMGTASNELLTLGTSLIPAISSIVMLYYVQEVRNNVEDSFENVAEIEDQLDKKTDLSTNNFPFLYLVFSLFFVSFFVIEIQQFATLIGLYEYKNTHNISTIVLYSTVAIAQTLLGLAVSHCYCFIKNKKPRWGVQFKSQFWYSAFALTILFFKTNPLTLLATGSFSKVLHEAFGDNNDKAFFSNIPSYIRSKVENITKTYVYFTATAVASFLVFLAMKSAIPMKVLWIAGVVASIAGLFLRVELQKVFADYHIGQIVRGDIYEAVDCCEHLSTPEAQKRCGSITTILNQSPRPFLAKALLKVLGDIESPDIVPELIQYYNNAEREDIKLAALKSLVKYESHHIDLFLLESLEDIIKKDEFKTETKRDLFNVISEKLQGIAIPMILKVLKENATEFRIIANTILVLGEIAVKSKDDSLFLLLSRYTKPIYSRRIRSNASLYLFHHRKYKEIANSCMSSLLTSSNEYDRNAVAYMAGELKVYTMTPFILESSENYGNKNTTLLISLLKLDHPKAVDYICDLLQSKDESDILGILCQVNMITQKEYRYKIYYRYLELYSDKINHLLDHMGLTQKNFDEDRMTIRNEAIKLGCYITADKKLFLRSSELLKVA